jgi:hypothetical protein
MDGLTKSSEGESLETLLTDPTVGAQNAAQGDSLRRLALASIAAMGAGAAVRGIQGINTTLGEPVSIPFRRAILPIPLPPKPSKEKAANVNPNPGFSEDPLAWASNHAANWLGMMKAPGASEPPAGSLLSGWGRSFADKPATYALGVPLVAGGLYAGYKGVGHVADQLRNRDQDQELEEARRAYEQALLHRFSGKAASEQQSWHGELDALYEKRANVGLGTATGLGLLGLGGLAGVSGIMTYNYARDNSRRKVLEAAVRRRQEAILASSPPGIVAVPTPIEPEFENKAANAAAAADQWINAQRSKEIAAWQRLMPQDSKSEAKPAAPDPNAPVPLPSVVAKPAPVGG